MRLCLILILFLGLNSWVFEQKLQANTENHYSPISKAQTSLSATKVSPNRLVTQINQKTRVSKVNAGPINVACVFAVEVSYTPEIFNDIVNAGLQKALVDGLINTLDTSTPTSDSQYESILSSYASSGTYDLVIALAVSMAQQTTVNNVAQSYPTQPILLPDRIGTQIVTQGNVSSVVFKTNEGSFLAGAMAGLMTQTGKIGFIGGMDIPLIRRFWAGYKAGAFYERNRSFIEVIENYVGSWDDNATGKTMAEAMWNQDVDIIFAAAGNSGLGVLESAAEEGLGFYAIGVDSDQDSLFPGSILTSTMKRLDIAVYNGILDVCNNNWDNDVKYLGLAENGVGISPLIHTKNVIGSEIIQEVNVTVRNKIISGEFIVPNDSTSLDQWITDMGIITGPISIPTTTTTKTNGVTPAWPIHLILLSLCAILPLKRLRRKK
jgi:basic membrane protein A